MMYPIIEIKEGGYMEQQEKEPTPEEKKKALFLNQKHTLDLFLERGAISKAQYDKSLGDLTVKMGITEERYCD